MKELKPCPFCGSDDIVFAGLEDAVYRLCCECGAEGGAYDDEESAIDMWNTRHIPEGYALVPIEPTKQMLIAMASNSGEDLEEMEEKYKAAIAVAQGEE